MPKSKPRGKRANGPSRKERAAADPGFALALEKAGNKKNLAEAAGVTKQAVNLWTRVPAERARKISDALGIPLKKLRPDLW